MKRVLLGSLLVLTLQFGFTQVSQAAEIPPTEECISTYRTLSQQYADAFTDGATIKELRKAERGLAEGLADAGCVSDPEPLLKQMPAKPFTPECVEGAAAAESFWAPDSKRVNALMKKEGKTVSPYYRKISKITGRIRSLRAKGGEGRQIKRLSSKRRALGKIAARKSRQINRKFMQIVHENAYANSLILVELLSRRCGGGKLFETKKPKGPAARAIAKNGALVWSSFFYVTFKPSGYSDSGAQSSGALPNPLNSLGTATGPLDANIKSLPLLK